MKDFAKHLVDLFYPLVEATVYTESGALEEIFNPFSTAKEDQALNLQYCQLNTPFSEGLTSGKNVKSLIYPLPKGYFRLRYDLTHFKNLQEQLQFLVQPALPSQKTDSWKEILDQTIHAYLADNKLTLQALSMKQKRELISKLQVKGLLDFKESSAYVASKLQISRATVYNYLKTTSEFKKVRVHQVDAFTNKKFGGNPAGVVLDADGLDETIMRKIARELNLSETAFVLESKKADLQMRYFTPTGHEIGFCGHSTVGALYMIAKEKEEKGRFAFQVETLSGILPMEVDISSEIQVAYEAPAIKLQKAALTHAEVAQAGGFDLKGINTSYPVMYEKTNKDLFIVANSLNDLKKIECESKSFAQFSKQHDIVALCVFCPETFDPKNQFHMRCFAPLVGIPEDPFTGSVLGGLAACAKAFLMLKNINFRVEQGHFMQRPGTVKVEYKNNRAKVIAQAVHCFSTEIQLT